MNSFNLVAIVLVLFFAMGCVKQEQKTFPDEPRIYYLGLNNRVISFADSASRLKIYIKLEDGDGDIARKDEESIYISQFRSDTVYDKKVYNLPIIEQELRQGDWLEGEFTIDFPPGTLVPRSDSFHMAVRKDTAYFQVYIKDEAGHLSNTITTDVVYIQER